jgi:hypothetical protein
MLNAMINPPQAKPTTKYDNTLVSFMYSGFRNRYGAPYLTATLLVIIPKSTIQNNNKSWFFLSCTKTNCIGKK